MANINPPSVDFFSLLPPEIVLKVLLYLAIEDVVQCLLVCRVWYELLSGLEPYWRRACVEFGLSETIVRRLRSQFVSSKALLFAGRKHQLGICATPPRLSTLSCGYPFDVRYACQYASGRTVVGTVYKDFKPLEIIVERIDRKSVTRTSVFPPQFDRTAANRVIWGHVSAASNFLLFVTASGIWNGYDLTSNLCLFNWRGEPMYDSDVRIGFCESCLTVCTAKLVSFRTTEDDSYWDLRVLRIGRNLTHYTPQMMRFKLLTGRSDITPRRANCGMRRVCLLPYARQKDSNGFCQSHTLLIQWANSIAAHVLVSKDNTCILFRQPHLLFKVPCRKLEEVVVRNLGLNSEFCLSSDSQLIGMILGAHLHVWNVQTAESLGSKEIVLEKYSYEQMRLIALGHIYSIIGLEFNDGVLVVVNKTGRVVVRCSRFAQKHCRMVPPYIEFLSAVSEDWLSDINCPCSADLPAVIYWNKTNRAIEGIFFGSRSGTGNEDDGVLPARKKKSWWNRK